MGIIRRIKKIVIGRNPGDNTADNLGETGEVHNLSDQDGSLESVYYEETLNQHCGCKPLCREHSHYITVANGRTMPFCKRCYSRIARKQRRQRITGLLLAPFIEQEANNEQ